VLKALYTVRLRSFVRMHGNMRGNDFHHRIFEAIKTHDADAAREGMTEHLTDVLYNVRLDATKKTGLASGEDAVPA
jgi:DNA-binding GntR family transcriptional regulator